MKVAYPILIKAALKVYSERLRGSENQSEATKDTLDQVLDLRNKKITVTSKKVIIDLT